MCGEGEHPINHCKVKPTRNDRGLWATSGKVYLYSQTFKSITEPCRQMMMKRIVCTLEGVELIVSISMVGRAEVMLVKTVETRRVHAIFCIGVGLSYSVYFSQRLAVESNIHW